MAGLGSNLAISLFITAILAYIFNGGKNLIMVLISLELILLSIGILLLHLSFNMDDLIGSTLTLYILPLAGCESALGLALLIAYYPSRGSIQI
uniref:NADH-ubiquinone oxidoreductase chain 4L n=1 Tax=Synchytrium endobioticum TaxID=286115 RepID=A0A4P8NMQ8_9FUNG|nr:NADH dehydrogenase subunit 4L [Synchytrium endobioticum]QCQ68434.1 NADH dehydrogenase subunit 4L [Synchytrium endobioticum]QCQ68453.1 NADH dehydrogenase subunit 4L [Synchytrium endobioticum]QCQ68472.1 NADH dehydrogenase subunit 4L [Synchytrium endobioticum]QCQ68491.1 NADH dehydrogenase subunit 4L [Synchytrium endobioticum]QCQ68510.1 NADH dehydrogenase subunit 4L [Synchytrium endobioticum]